ncbi:Ldh family oxidoreductase [Siculibacillus lacustris]|uniref:Ldh family oxidoreductase n=1 Tax=Siculibacillus lacustris TaxID=1549641 RepID=A0A4Q9VIX3_9HYPH|nr:Ldh family oxidoreductase [Siculibacillus lacustris]TBW35106.1 Ldh family oxidoreductase [Siculibacillus lacustris]
MRHPYADLVAHAAHLLAAAGLDGDKPTVVAERLVRADAMGHTTHGLALLPAYLRDIGSGAMTRSGEPAIVVDRPAAVVWDGRRLPGVWLTARAVDLAVARARDYGTCTVVIRRSHHIAALAAYLTAATDAGMMVVVASSDPAAAHVAPYGGKRALFTPDPVAIGIPTEGDPILIDISASITTAGLAARLTTAGRPLPGVWALDGEGRPTDAADVLSTDPRGSLLPIGGIDHGHKGYGLALWIEALTQGLSGWGRADGEAGWGGAVFVQVFDPELFAGGPAFRRQTEWLAENCRANPPIDPEKPVRLPGSKAAAGVARAQAEGLELFPGILEALVPWAERLGVAALDGRA